jgi:hypothetical protein
MDSDICMDIHHIPSGGLINKVKHIGLNYILEQKVELKI